MTSIYRNDAPAFDDEWLHDETPPQDPEDGAPRTPSTARVVVGMLAAVLFGFAILTGELVSLKTWFEKEHHLTTPLGTFYAIACLGATVVALVFFYAGVWRRTHE